MIIGAGGHGKVVADCGVAMGYEDIVFLDDDKQVKTCGKYPVVGAGREFRRIVGEDAIGGWEYKAEGSEGDHGGRRDGYHADPSGCGNWK